MSQLHTHTHARMHTHLHHMHIHTHTREKLTAVAPYFQTCTSVGDLNYTVCVPVNVCVCNLSNCLSCCVLVYICICVCVCVCVCNCKTREQWPLLRPISTSLYYQGTTEREGLCHKKPASQLSTAYARYNPLYQPLAARQVNSVVNLSVKAASEPPFLYSAWTT